MKRYWQGTRLAKNFTNTLHSMVRMLRKTWSPDEAWIEGDTAKVSVDILRDLDELPQDMQMLFEKAEHEYVELGVSWYRNLIKSVYPDHAGIRIYVLRRNGLPVGVLPIIRQSTTLGHHAESLSNYYTPIYAPFFEPDVKAQDLVPLIRTLLEDNSPLTAIKLSAMDPDSRAFRLLLEAMRLSGLATFRFFCFGNWYLPIACDWPAYFRSREGILRNTIKRMGKDFSAAGGTFELIRDVSDLERGLVAYERVYASSWKQPEPYPMFVPELVRACAARGWLRLGIAWLNDEAVAAQIWIIANGKANIYKLAFDERYRKYAPGTLLTAMLMQQAFESDRVTEVDYLMGDDPYKKSWMDHRRERWGIVAYNPRSIGGMLGLTRKVFGRLLKRLAEKPRNLESGNAECR